MVVIRSACEFVETQYIDYYNSFLKIIWQVAYFNLSERKETAFSKKVINP